MALYFVLHPEDKDNLFNNGPVGMLNSINTCLFEARTPLDAARQRVWGNNPTSESIKKYMDECVVIEVTSTSCLVDVTQSEEYQTLKQQEDEKAYNTQKEKDIAELKRIQDKYKIQENNTSFSHSASAEIVRRQMPLGLYVKLERLMETIKAQAALGKTSFSTKTDHPHDQEFWGSECDKDIAGEWLQAHTFLTCLGYTMWRSIIDGSPTTWVTWRTLNQLSEKGPLA